MSVKLKGIFQSGFADTEHNPHGIIITDAVVAYFQNDLTPAEYINRCADIRPFLFVRKVTGGASFAGEHAGKVVRFYYSNTSDESLHYENNNNLVPKSTNCRPLMNIPERLPDDLDKERYITEAEELLATVNIPAKTGRNKRVVFYTQMGLSLVPWPWKGLTIVKEGFDFSAITKAGIQTGYRAKTIAINKADPYTLTMGNWSFYTFDDNRYPGAMKTVSKKLGFDILYGGAIELAQIPTGTIRELPDILKNSIFNNMGLAQRRKAVDGVEFLL